MKKILTTTLLISLIGLIGCGGESNSSSYQNGNNTDSKKDNKITTSGDQCKMVGATALYITKGSSCKFIAKGLLNNTEQTISCSDDGVIQLNNGVPSDSGILSLKGYTFKCK